VDAAAPGVILTANAVLLAGKVSVRSTLAVHHLHAAAKAARRAHAVETENAAAEHRR
jgi:hypothetical protein